MIVAALDPDIQMLWWVTLAAGLVVAIVVVVLLHTLLKTVEKVQRNVITLWETATTVAQNTATTWMLEEEGVALDELRSELLRHDRLLSERSDR